MTAREGTTMKTKTILVLALVMLTGCATMTDEERRSWGRAFTAFGQGSSQPAKATTQSEQAKRCTSDYSCGYGAKCVKAEYRSEGYCAKAVDQYGIPTFSPPNPNSV